MDITEFKVTVPLNTAAEVNYHHNGGIILEKLGEIARF